MSLRRRLEGNDLMVDEALPNNMRIRSLMLAAIITLSSLSIVIANDTVTTQDVELSGNHTMNGNYTVSHGTTLTIKPGTTIDMQNYWMKVEGTLIADNTTIMSSIQTTGLGSHNAGVWDSLTITQMGSATLDNVTISNAKSCLIIDGDLTATTLTIEDCLIGIEVDGTATIEGLSASHIDHDGMRVTGDADVSMSDFDDVSGGVHSSGDLVLSGSVFSNAGVGVALTGGTADVENLNFITGVGNAVTISSGVSGDVDGMEGQATNAIVSMDSTGFTVSNIDMSGERLVNSWSAGDLTISDASFFADSPETPIDLRTSGTVTLSEINLTGQFSSGQNSYNAPWIGMALAGSGDYHILDSIIEATDSALKASGTGTLSITDTKFSSDRIGLSFSGISSTSLDNVIVNISMGGEKGIDILQGAHSFSGLEVNMPFNQFSSGSTGIEVWWCNIDAEDIAVNGFANSMSVYESVLDTEDLTLLDSSKQGLFSSSSMISVSDSLETRISDNGLVMISSNAVLRTWAASYHEDGGLIDSDSEVTVWSLTSIGNLNSDSSGNGTLNYGTSQTLNLDVSTNNRLWEMTINFEDLAGNSVDADWQVLGFRGTANAGSAILPVSETGSQITATYAGVGALSTPIGVQGGSHTIQVPIMPQGDWVLSGGAIVVLGPTEDGTPHSAGGNITIPTNAQLILQDTSLTIPEGATLTVDSYGDFEGINSNFHGDIISHSALFSDAATSSLTVDGDVLWTSCQNDMTLFNLNVIGDIQLDNSCKVAINSGSASSNVSVGVGAIFEIENTLHVTVLDKGEGVQGATITVAGQSVSTDSSGQASKSTTAMLVDSSGTSTAGLMQVGMTWGQITDLMAWDTSSSMEHTFVASTITGGTLTEWLELEKAWSPYHLTSDLVIPHGQTMTVNDGVFLRVADQVTITVEGTFNSGFSTISSMGEGARWGGLIVGDNTETSAQILGTSLVEGSPLIAIDGQADVLLSNAYLARSSSAEPLLRTTNAAQGTIHISSTSFSDSASHCIEAQGSVELSMSDVEMQNCHSNAIWTQGLLLAIDGLTASDTVTLGGVDGYLSNFVGQDVVINNLDGFMMSDLTLTSLNGSDNREINIDDASFNGAPAIDLDNSAGSLTYLVIDCGGSGTGLTAHHGRASASLTVSDSTISSCTKGIDLHTDGESAPLVLMSVDIDSIVAISTDGADVTVHDGTLNGSVDVDSAIVNLYDVEPTYESVTFGEIRIWSTHIFDVRLGGNAQNADLVFEVGDYWAGSAQGNSIEVALPTKVVSDVGSENYSSVRVIASANNLPDTDKYFAFGIDEADIIQIDMIGNQAPDVEIIIPDDGFRIMETLPIEIRAVISDDLDSNEDLEIVWKVVFGQTEMMQLSGEWNNITDLPAGTYVLSLEVTDAQGKSSSDSLSFEITLLDSDGDWILSCNSETWFDKDENLYCGPDVYDTDDDNDGSLDIRDAWPNDACASLDSDGDGQPDELHCPIGVTTWLTEDPDDDGDGIPDVSESSGASEETEGNTLTMVIFVILFLAAAGYMLMRRNQGVE